MARTLEAPSSVAGEKFRPQEPPTDQARPQIERSIRRYDFLVREIEQQMKDVNESKKDHTGVVAGMGDWIGEKTGAYWTGKEVYASIIARSAEQSRELHAKLVAEFSTKPLEESDRKKIDDLAARLEKASWAKLAGVSWADAVLNTSGGKDFAPVKYGVRATFWTLEGAYEGVAGIAEISGKTLWLLAAYSLEPQARGIIEEDVSKILSALTLENAKKLLSILPAVLEDFQKLPADKQVEGAAKLLGNILVPLGIGTKGIQAGKAVSEAGRAAIKAGAETIKKWGVRAVAAGAATVALGTGEVALANAAKAWGYTVRYVGEMGGGGPKKAGGGIESAEKNAEALRKAVEANPALSQKIEKELSVRKLDDLIEDLTGKADVSKVGMSEKDIVAMGTKAKELIREIASNEKISVEAITFLSDIKHVLGNKLEWASLKSLTHILESIVDGANIPKNPKITEMLRGYGNISQSDFFVIVAIFHDLEKNFMPAQFLPDLHAILKGKNLASHQLDSANFLKELGRTHPEIRSAIERIAKRAGAKGPEWLRRAMQEIAERLAEAYERVLRFFESKGLVDPKKRGDLADLMFDVIKGHAANTEFIQVDTARGARNAMRKVAGSVDAAISEGKNVWRAIDDIKALLSPPNWDGALAREFEALATNARDASALRELSQKFVLKTFLKATAGTDIPLWSIDLKEFEALVDALNANVKNGEFRNVLKTGDAASIDRIVAEKALGTSRVRELSDKYLHARSKEPLREEARFAFNLNDIVGYAKPNSEGFIKLIGLEGGPQGGFDLMLASPFNSLAATLAEMKTKAAISGEYARMYAAGLENAESLTRTYGEKMASPFVWEKGMPQTLRQFDWATFGKAYESLADMWPKFGDNVKDATKFDQTFASELTAIKQHFVSEFKTMCSKVPTKEIYS